MIDRQRAHAAPVGQDRQPTAGKRTHLPQRARGGEQFVQRAHAQQAGTAERGAVHRIRARQVLRMRAAGGRDLGAAAVPGLHHDDRFGTRGGTRGRHELARVADRFHVQQDRAGTVIGGEVVQQVGEVDVQRIAQRHHGGEADRLAHAPFDQATGDGTRLRNQCEVAGLRETAGQTGVEARVRRDHAQAVRAEHAQASLAREGFELRGGRAGSAAHRRGQHHHRTGTFLRSLRGQLRHRCRRRGDHHQVRRPRQVAQVARDRDAVHRRRMLVHQPDLALEAAGAQVLDHRTTHRAWPRLAAHHRHGARTEDRIEAVGAHGGTAFSGCRQG